MRQPVYPSLLPAAPMRTELVLRLEDGSPWLVSFSSGVERFIGLYPRLPEMRCDGPLLEFRAAAAAV